MILGCDSDLSGAEILDGMVSAAMAKLELVGFTTKAMSEDLVT